MLFGKNGAKARLVRRVGSSQQVARQAVERAARQSIEQLEDRWLLAANPIGVNFVGNNGGTPAQMAPADTAGVVPSANYNNVAASTGSALSLNDSTGAASGATMDWNAGGNWASVYSTTFVPGNADQKLNNGFLYSNNAGGVPAAVTINNLPYSGPYDVYVYTLNDGVNRLTTTTLNGTTSYYGRTADPNDGKHETGTNTPYLYTQSSSADQANPTAGGDYVLFVGVTGTSVQFQTDAPGNGAMNGFQIVPETAAPAAPVLATPTTSSNLVVLSWTDSSAALFDVYRSSTGVPAAPVARAFVSTFRYSISAAIAVLNPNRSRSSVTFFNVR